MCPMPTTQELIDEFTQIREDQQDIQRDWREQMFDIRAQLADPSLA